MTTPGFVRLLCDDPPLNVDVLLGADAPKLSGGVGGWEVKARPRQVGMTTWNGVEPFELALPLLFEGWRHQASQEGALGDLLRVARGDDESPPGVLIVYGIPIPVAEWVIEGIDYDDPIARPSDMARVRQPVTLTLREYVPPTYLQGRTLGVRVKGKTAIVVVKRGDTPALIARRRHCKWTDLRDLNRKVVHKANQKLVVGTKLRVPMAAARRRKRTTTSKGSRKR